MGAALACTGVYTPRRPRASPLFLLVEAHFPALHAVYDTRSTTSASPRRMARGAR
jgi:hypothetical protein